jgi:hypothetical protein
MIKILILRCVDINFPAKKQFHFRVLSGAKAGILDTIHNPWNDLKITNNQSMNCGAWP